MAFDFKKEYKELYAPKKGSSELSVGDRVLVGGCG